MTANRSGSECVYRTELDGFVPKSRLCLCTGTTVGVEGNNSIISYNCDEHIKSVDHYGNM